MRTGRDIWHPCDPLGPKLNGKCTSITTAGIGNGEYKLRMVRVMSLGKPPRPESMRGI